jgi:hypothetical protein
LTLTPSPDPADVRMAILASYPEVSIPRETVAGLLELVARTGIGDLSATEQAVADAIRADGGVARISRIAARVAPLGIARTTAAVCLSRSPLFRAVDRGRWTITVREAA